MAAARIDDRTRTAFALPVAVTPARAVALGLAGFALLVAAGCGSTTQPAMETVNHVNLERFMGDWYVIASIPTYLESEAYNAVESYRLDAQGRIRTTFTFRDGGFDGPLKRYTPTGYVRDEDTNAVWGMQFVWPFKADYRIVYLAGDYSRTVIARKARDYAWLMARTPSISEADYAHMVAVLRELGYDTSRIRRVPQRWG